MTLNVDASFLVLGDLRLVVVDLLVKLFVFPSILVKLGLDILDIESDAIVGLVGGLLKVGQLFFQPLVHLLIVALLLLDLLELSLNVFGEVVN